MMHLNFSSMLILTALGLSISSASQAENLSQSKNPPPNSGDASQPIQKNPTLRKQPPSNDQRGTEKMPLFIKGIPTEKTPNQAAEDREEREIKTALDRDLTLYTGYQAIFTLVLIIVGSLQLGLFGWQLRMMRKSLVDGRSTARSALKTAQSLVRTERAYVFAKVEEAIFTLNADGVTNIQVKFQFINYG